jgi:hypothetical protein
MAILKDARIVKTHQLTAEIEGYDGKRVITIMLDGEMAIKPEGEGFERLYEWNGIWYDDLGFNGPYHRQESISPTPEGALDWWMQERGFIFADNGKL